MITIAITGGKGGTGKTLIATNLATQFAKEGKSVLLIDTDVENPNSNILLDVPLNGKNVQESFVKIFTPNFDPELCSKCGLCRDSCYRHAILQFPNQTPSLLEHMCSGCQTCAKICPEKAISAKGRTIGKQYYIPDISPNLDLLIGELTPGEAVSVLIVEEILEFSQKLISKKNYDLIILDTAPGAHCDVEKSLGAADQIIAVTEPSPFGSHDLKRIIELIHLNKGNPSIILNRSNLCNYRDKILDEITAMNVSLLGEIPVDRCIIENYAKGKPFINDERDFPGKEAFLQIYRKINHDINLEGAKN